ncbi:TPM domain-containing protein [uncultured Selenomonas sp.]|uniref:TPM domain-containing protein n=1 Tax=uncultured Selenomonas sp. TaxID=159275 RepID=UPI0028E5765F|nr:TPM domain-containing protein [uncultured Selenomonas sp.]
MFTKNKKSLSALLALLLLLCLTSIALAVPRQAAPPPKAQTQEQTIGADRVIDEAEILTDSEEAALDTKLAAIEQSHKVRILIGTMKSTDGTPLGKIANNVVDQIPADNGTIVLLLSMKERDWYVSTDNKMRVRITDGKGIEYLSGEFLPDLKEGKYAAAFTTFAATTDEMLTYYEKEGAPYDPANAFNLMALGIALACALILGGTIYYMLYEYESNVTFAAEADAYLNHDSFRLTQNEDNFLYTTVTRRTKEKKESSSGSNVSTSSSDSSHGGGGGKF